ncbi:MAG: 3-dehydroquinate dehydratase [Ignavibacteriaceae bacterium]|mgnify:CR=1 FL=1|jgi:3-dehydroquinate dehydratase-2|uniref:type II 3-dehydroquinate dehydratase n=1 Tax=Ignavibacterium TaxID=795750 RepID=UPI00208B1827|nr:MULTISPECIES: type II 3-dehydroquinate dehydratase [Ignavibacterium]MBI5662923.1 3-dehydroquinate dehydratase [Ignavibacterium album]GJQ44195.1 MAG: 3-dehydroquinate dehydratase [Ignavibacteriaceae bacterium]
MNILILNGPNLNLISHRDNQHYGTKDFDAILDELRQKFPFINFTYFQSNSEGDLINKIQDASDKYDGLIINPGGYAHTSVAIKDALEICKIPKVEVHLSNLAKRENYRQILLTASSCDGYISGFKDLGYYLAVEAILKLVDNNN